jgi:tartrate dehydrogenase/decarboxylase/D-malate dehydrogenase
MPEGVRVVDAAARKFGIDLALGAFPISAAGSTARSTASTSPDDWKERIVLATSTRSTSVPLGWPEKGAGTTSRCGAPLILFRREFDQYGQLAPGAPDARHRLPGGAQGRAASASPARSTCTSCAENTRGRVLAIGGRMYPGTEREIVMQENVMSRVGVDRVLKFALRARASRAEKAPDQATKSNGIAITMPYWDERCRGDGESSIPA